MATKNNIVTFEEARRSAKRRRNQADSRNTHAIEDRSSDTAQTRKVSKAEIRKQARNDAKRQRTKARAERQFTKMYGGETRSLSKGSGASADTEGSPRAAVYQAKMGSKHRKAAHALQQKASDGVSAAVGFLGRFSLPRIELGKMPKHALRILVVIGCCAFLTLMLYTPAQQCYLQIRERDRVAAEYAAVLDRNEALLNSVDTLQSDEGIEDKAHAEYGMVKEDEEAGSVTGIDVQSSTDFVANVIPGGVPAPDTWYSDFLDFLFGYSNPS